jgi:hypothetical protein
MIRPEIQNEIDLTNAAFADLRAALAKVKRKGRTTSGRRPWSDDVDERVSALCELMRTYGAHRRMDLRQLSWEIARTGGSVGSSASILKWFADNWPEDLEWPAGIDRPSISEGGDQ